MNGQINQDDTSRAKGIKIPLKRIDTENVEELSSQKLSEISGGAISTSKGRGRVVYCCG
jgi:hypothetical protein